MNIDFDDAVFEEARASIQEVSERYGWPDRVVSDDDVIAAVVSAMENLLEGDPQPIYEASSPVCEGPGTGDYCQRGGNYYHWHYSYQIVDLSTVDPREQNDPGCPSAHRNVMFGYTKGSPEFAMWCGDCHAVFRREAIDRRPDIVEQLKQAAMNP